MNSGKDDKQQLARSIAVADGISRGPICALTAVELCSSYAVRGNRSERKIELQRSYWKCPFVYQYWMHPVFGFMSARLQTWFPFPIYLYWNGREWLARQMEQAGICYRRHDNCFTWIENFSRAQKLMAKQLRADWVQLFNAVAQQAHPLLAETTQTRNASGVPCDAVWPAYIAGPRFPNKRWTATVPPWRRWTTAPLSSNSPRPSSAGSAGTANPSGPCIRSIPRITLC